MTAADDLRREAEAAARKDHDRTTDDTGTPSLNGCTKCSYFVDGYEAGAAAERPRAEARGRVAGLEWALTQVPQSWLDPMLTGPEAVEGMNRIDGPFNRVVERLFLKVRERITAELARLRGGA